MFSVPITTTLALALAAAAAVVDFRERRIPNRLTYPLILIGIATQTVLHGRVGLFSSLAGGLLFGGVFMVFYLVNAMGAGDVKLATALGCIVGVAECPPLMYAVALSGGLVAIIYVVFSRKLGETLRNTFKIFGFHARHGLQSHPDVNLNNPKALRMPYGLAFAAGTLYWALSPHVWK